MDFYYESVDEKTRVHAVKYKPQGEIRGVIQIIHGMNEYIGRYDELARFLCDNGFMVVGNDHIGHGESIENDDNLGYFCEKEGNKVLLKDIVKLMNIAQRECPDIPYYIIGHSMGSFMLRHIIALYGDRIDGAVICATGNQPGYLSAFGMVLCNLLSIVNGDHYRSKFVAAQMFKGYNKRITNKKTDFDWIVSDERVVEKYINDPKCNYIYSLNGYNNFMKIINGVNNKSLLNRIPKDLPVFFIAGEEDPVAGYGKYTTELVKLYEKIGIKNVDCKLYPNARHEIHNDYCKETVFDDIINWIDKLEENKGAKN
ncbi:MAG: alpha/beta hydrolase [Lachnospiraceae bacterium]|nr:alpha/beta hydrolase [Lachnospiraceae bacterium]